MLHRVSLVLLLLASPVLAQQTPASQDTLAAVFRETLKDAKQGDIEAQEAVAVFYLYGLGVGRDDEAAKGWYHKAAAAGSAGAMSAIGVMHEEAKDYAGAFEWYSRAAERGYPHAVYRLGIMHQQGWHVPQDGSTAVRLLQDAAWLDSAEAQQYLGLLYFQGQLVPKNYPRSYAYLNLAAPKKPAYAKMRDLVEKQLTSEQLAEAQKLSLEWSDRVNAARK